MHHPGDHISHASLVFVMTCSSAVQVRHMFAQCITAMAHHQYLELEGGHKLVEFVVKQCALSDEEVGHILKLNWNQYTCT